MISSIKNRFLFAIVLVIFISCNPEATQPILISTVTPILPQSSPSPQPIQIWLSPDLPHDLMDAIQIPYSLITVPQRAQSDLQVEPCDSGNIVGHWVYSLVAPFPSVLDGVEASDLINLWHGEPSGELSEAHLLIDYETEHVMSAYWGDPLGENVEILDTNSLLDTAWERSNSFSIVSFTDLVPRWKVITVDEISPLTRDLDISTYELAMPYCLGGNSTTIAGALTDGLFIPSSNRDEDQMTVLVMTGVTALVRQTAARMEEEGVLFPSEQIGRLLRAADITHISNEVSFFDFCPRADLHTWQFCAPPDYLELLESVGTDVVELTGNHLLDYGTEPFLFTLDLYQQAGMAVYGGGENLDAAQQPLLLVNHGNRIAFLGCNPVGPESDWAGENSPGAAPCDDALITRTIQDLTEQGYNVVMTFQHIEACQLEPLVPQLGDFLRAAMAGAVIIQGSQAHCPQGFAFEGDSFLHFGLGNLFFDQMDSLTSREFIDRHVFYQNHYISTEILTAQLEDYSQPRLMTYAERRVLLESAFESSGWRP